MKQPIRPSMAAVAGSLGIMSLLTSPPPVAAQVTIESRAVELGVSGRLQFQFRTSSCTDASPAAGSACAVEAPGLDMFVRRARMSLDATIDERLSFRIEPEFGDLDAVDLKDAWGSYAPGAGVSVKAGHFMRPFDGFHLTSSSQLPFERAVVVPGVPSSTLASYSGLTKTANLSDRDIGLAVEASPGAGPLTLRAGAFRGGTDEDGSDSNAGKQLVGRARLALEAGGAPLELAAAAALSDLPYTDTDGETREEYYTNVELWAGRGAWDRDGLLVQAGLVLGDNPLLDPLGGPADPAQGEYSSLLAWQAVAAYRMPVPRTDRLEAVTPLLRVSYGDPSDAADDETLSFTPGLAIYFHGRNRLALTWDVATFAADGMGAEHSFTSQMQFHF